MRYSSLFEYSLTNYFYEECTLCESFIRSVASEYDLDLDKVYDVCEEKRLPFKEYLENYINYVYNNSDEYKKSKIFYKFVHDFGLSLLNFTSLISNEIVSSMEEFKAYTRQLQEPHQDINSNENRIIIENRIRQYVFNLEDSIHQEYLYRIEKVNTYIKLFIDTFNKLKENVFFTFNDVIKIEYQLEFDKSSKIFNDFLDTVKEELNAPNRFIEIKTIIPNLNNNSFDSYLEFWNNSSTNTVSYINTLSSVHTYTESTYIDTYNNFPTLLDTKFDLVEKLDKYKNIKDRYQKALELTKRNNLQLVQKEFLKNYINSVPQRKLFPMGYTKFKKSLKVLSKFVSGVDINKLIVNKEVYENTRGYIIEGKLFNWEFIVNKNECLKYSEKMDEWSINYKFYVLTKENVRICRLCIVYKGSPILDQILSNILNIKSNKEIYILENSGFFDKNKYLFDSFINPLIRNSEQDRLNRIEGLQNSYNSVNYAIKEFRVKVSSQVRNHIINNLQLFIPKKYIDYSINLDVSWGEAVDYAAFNLFNVDIFDDLVKNVDKSLRSNNE